jgi:hypothetical protein
MEYINKLITFRLFNNENPRTSFVKPLLYFYAAIGLSLISDLYSGQLIQFIKENRYAKHIIGLIIMMILTMDVAKVNNSKLIFLYSLILYAIFVLSTKVDLKWSIIIITLLLAGSIYEHNMTIKEQESSNDKTLKPVDLQTINKYHDKTKTVIIMSIILIVIFGLYKYVTKKKTQYGGNFDIDKFVLFSGKKNMKFI